MSPIVARGPDRVSERGPHAYRAVALLCATTTFGSPVAARLPQVGRAPGELLGPRSSWYGVVRPRCDAPRTIHFPYIFRGRQQAVGTTRYLRRRASGRSSSARASLA